METNVAALTPSVAEGAVSEPPVSSCVPTAMTAHELVERNADFVFRSLRRAGLDAATVDDATQQVFLVAFDKLDRITRGEEKGFLYATAMNIAARHKRKSFRLGEVAYEEDADEALASDETLSVDELLDQRRARELLDEVLSNMPDKLRDVFVLCEIEELTNPEVAACLDLPLGTVASRLLRAREVFDQALTRVRARRAFRKGMR